MNQIYLDHSIKWLKNKLYQILPVAQMQPPTIAKGQNLGQCNITLTTKATNHMAAQSTHWRNIPGKKKKTGVIGSNWSKELVCLGISTNYYSNGHNLLHASMPGTLHVYYISCNYYAS